MNKPDWQGGRAVDTPFRELRRTVRNGEEIIYLPAGSFFRRCPAGGL